MREIKFRAWFKGGTVVPPRMETPASWLLLSQIGQLYAHGPLGDFRKEKDDNYEIMFYTGLKDKNGVEVYEGDICSDGEQKFIIKWDEKYALFWMAHIGDDMRVGLVNLSWVEVIGNIFGNPELIDEG